mmetsp:Transcript_139343/g.197282  ORF Transcript_139343/g.197282 Transcript_139343/m.197282 type:complete len:81 (+) Transcript_139343:32-274(+)
MVAPDLSKQRAAEANLNLTGSASRYKSLRQEASKQASLQLALPSLDQSRRATEADHKLMPYLKVPCPQLQSLPLALADAA